MPLVAVCSLLLKVKALSSCWIIYVVLGGLTWSHYHIKKGFWSVSVFPRPTRRPTLGRGSCVCTWEWLENGWSGLEAEPTSHVLCTPLLRVNPCLSSGFPIIGEEGGECVHMAYRAGILLGRDRRRFRIIPCLKRLSSYDVFTLGRKKNRGSTDGISKVLTANTMFQGLCCYSLANTYLTNLNAL